MPKMKTSGKIILMVFAAGIITATIIGLKKYVIPEGAKAGDVTGLMKGSDSSSTEATTGTPTAAPANKCLEIGVVTWGGYAGGQYWNQGFKDNANSRYH